MGDRLASRAYRKVAARHSAGRLLSRKVATYTHPMGVAIAFLIFGVPAILYFAGQVIEWRMRNPRKVAPKADAGRIAKLERQLLDD